MENSAILYLFLSAVIINFPANGQLCSSGPCLNGGSCFELPSFYLCVCQSDFTGLRCEVSTETTSVTPTTETTSVTPTTETTSVTPTSYTTSATSTTNTTSATSTTRVETVFVSSAYNFSSPNYPSDYPNNFRFTWYFATQIEMQLALTLTAIDTKLDYDYITVQDGSEFFSELLLLWSGSGPANEVKVVSSGNVMSVTFETDGSVTATGFAAVIEVTSLTREELDCGQRFNCMNGVCLPQSRVCDNGEECGNGADEDSGNCPDVTESTSLAPTTESEYIFVAVAHYFSSPNYPAEYPNNLLYTWNFSSYPGSRLFLTFTDIVTENRFDYITVRNGNASVSGELLLRLSGEVSPNEVRILSSENDMLVIFETDTSVRRSGFAALVVVTCPTTEELDCGEEFDCNNGVCLPQNRACNGQVECGNDADERNDFCSVDNPSGELSTDFPEVTSLDYLTEEVSTDFETSSSTSIDYITKEVSTSTPSTTLQTTETTYSPTIEHETIFVNPAYYFTSPNYPKNYPKNLWYTWYISTFPGMQIFLTFFEINTEYCNDFISVREGNTSFSGELLFRMSGVALPNEVKVLSYGNGLVVTLETDRSVGSNGFAVVAETTSRSKDSLDCGQQLHCGNGACLPQSRLCDGQEECGNGADENNCTDKTTEKGPALSQSVFFVNSTRYFESPNYPANYPKNLNYSWYLSTLPNLQLLLTFYNVRTEYYYDYISVRDGNGSFNRELLLRFSGVSLSNNIRVLSLENDLVVTFESDKSVTKRGFTFLVETTSSVRDDFDCGQEFNCGNGVCLSQSRRCDGYEECGNGADENNCIDTITAASPPLSQREFTFIDSPYYFTSPNHPFDYPKNLRYTWYLSTFPGFQLLLTFFEVSTEYLYDFISVKEGNASFPGDELLRWSGVGFPREIKVLSVGNYVSLTFETDESVTSEGFTVFVETTNSPSDGLDCGQQFNCGNGVCLPQTRLCDSQQECGNGADENVDSCLDLMPSDLTTRLTPNDITTQLMPNDMTTHLLPNDLTTPVSNTAPIISCPTPSSFLQSDENNAVAFTDGACIDVEDGPLSLTCNETQNSLEVGNNYIGCSCIDASGSVAECVFIVNVPGSDFPPTVLNCPVPSIIETVTLDTTSATVFWTEPTATSNTGGFITIFRSHSPGEQFSVGETTVAYIFTDNPSEVTNTCTFLVIVQINETLQTSVCPNGTPTPQFTTSCLCNPGFGGNNCDTATTFGGPISCPSNGITTLRTAVTYPDPLGIPSGVDLVHSTLQSGSNDLPLGDNELLLIYSNGMENYVCQFTITVT